MGIVRAILQTNIYTVLVPFTKNTLLVHNLKEHLLLHFLDFSINIKAHKVKHNSSETLPIDHRKENLKHLYVAMGRE